MTERTYEKGNAIFFKHPQHSWVCGIVEALTDKNTYSCRTNDLERVEVKQGEIIEKLKEDDIAHVQSDALDDRPDDLLDLIILHDSTLLRCLYLRYMSDVIYTNIGAIVVALNPFNFKIPRYMDDQMKNYLAEGQVIMRNLPHSWAQAHNTYYEMHNEAENQCILISGESGAGKTEATKIVMKYLGNISCLQGNAEEKVAGLVVGSKLSDCSPILESFGNAKTVRNDNSSRFGKFVKVKFDKNCRLIGAHTTKYLLEKSRIITASLDERVYHAFYMVVRGLYKGSLHLEDESKYKSLNCGKCMHNPEYDTAEDFATVCKSMSQVGICESDIHSVWLVPAGILSLQNISFLEHGDGCTFTSDSAKYVHHVSKIWGIDETMLKHELLTSTRLLPGNQTATNLNSVVKAIDARDALCKGMYNGVFGWLVDKCNELCDVPTTGNWIGLLDIFGFEDFKHNSFEQICINLTNETLQNFYNNYIFTRDMEECVAEGIDVTEIKCPDNGPCLKMIVGQGGILPLLDEACWVGGTDKTFIEKVAGLHANNPFLSLPKLARDHFIIHHYAASVDYDANGWLEKNRDTLKDAIKFLVRRSPDPIIKVILPAPISPDQKRGMDFTVGGFFNDQLKDLMEVINSTNPHWIRCVKPHPAKKPKMFDGVQTMNQLESSGVLGTVKIRKAGYPVRVPLNKFLHRYFMLAVAGLTESKAIISSVLETARIEMPTRAQIGITKVFLKADAYQALEKVRIKALTDRILTLQNASKGYLARKSMFMIYLDKHRVALMAARRERELRERTEREAAERKRREEEERELRIREAEEKMRNERERAEAEMRRKCVNALQRYIRGGVARLHIYRIVLEQYRADFETQKEYKGVAERLHSQEVDVSRLRAEKQWVAWLQEVDELTRYKESERERLNETNTQKQRIQHRELSRKEMSERNALIELATKERETLSTKFEVILTHKKELEAQEHERNDIADSTDTVKNPTNALQRSPARSLNASLMSRSIAADARVRETLADYVLHRAIAFDQSSANNIGYTNNPSFMMNVSGFDLSRTTRSGITNNGNGKSSASPLNLVGNRSLFERSKNRWGRQEEWLYQKSSVSHVNRSFDNASYNGPYRVAPTTAAQTALSASPLIAPGGGVPSRLNHD